MRIFGFEISSQEVRLAVVQLNDEKMWTSMDKSKEYREEMGFSELILDI